MRRKQGKVSAVALWDGFPRREECVAGDAVDQEEISPLPKFHSSDFPGSSGDYSNYPGYSKKKERCCTTIGKGGKGHKFSHRGGVGGGGGGAGLWVGVCVYTGNTKSCPVTPRIERTTWGGKWVKYEKKGKGRPSFGVNRNTRDYPVSARH